MLDELKSKGMNIAMYDIEEDNKKAMSRGIMSIPVMIIYKEEEEEFERLVGIQSKENISYLMSE